MVRDPGNVRFRPLFFLEMARSEIGNLPLLERSLLLIWIGSMIAMPHILDANHTQILVATLSFSVLIQSALAFFFLSAVRGQRRALYSILSIGLLAWLIEFSGSTTGFPFGAYTYTDLLQPQLLGVPLLIPFAWIMMLPAAWAVADILGANSSRIQHALLSAAAFTAWDLFLDPQMVAWDLWRWDESGLYFGIPWTNYAGWFVASFLLSLIGRWLAGPEPGTPKNPGTGLLILYIATWLLESVGLAFYFSLPGPALVGFLVMGAFSVAALLRFPISNGDEERAASLTLTGEELSVGQSSR